MSNSRQGFSRQPNRGNNNQQNQNRGVSPSPSPAPLQTNSGLASRPSPLSNSPSVSSNLSANDSNAGGEGNNSSANAMPLFLYDKLQVFMVKGNYMTLAVKPKAVDIGEWIAHQGMLYRSSLRRMSVMHHDTFPPLIVSLNEHVNS